MLDRRYIKSKIYQKSETTWVLKIEYSYYSIFNFVETFICSTLEESKDKLIEERTHGNLIIVDLDQKML